jgi:hypothetical protein
VPAGEHLYWIDQSTFNSSGASNNDGTIDASNLDGTGAQVLLSKQANPIDLAVDGLPDGIYWTDFGAGAVDQATPRGTGATACTAGNFFCTRSLVSGQTGPAGLAVSGTASGGFIYWADEGGVGANDGKIMRSDLAGGNVTILVSGLNAPYGVTIDGSHMFWTDLGTFTGFGASNGDGKVMEANLDGTGVTTLASSQPTPAAIAVNASHIYWADSCSATALGGTIMESNLDGTGATTLVSGLDCPTGVAVDSSHLYWSDGADGTITAAGLDGSSPNVVISGQFNLGAVAAG